MPPDNPQGDLEQILNELYGADPAAGEVDGLGVGGVLGSAATVGGVGYLARNTRPGQFVRSLPSRIAGRRAAGQAGQMLGDLAGSQTGSRGARLAGRLGTAASRSGTAARSAAGRALPWAGRVASKAAAPVGAAMLGAELGTAAGQAFYDTDAGRAYTDFVDGTFLGGEGEEVLAGQEARGPLGNLGRAFAFLPGGPDHALPQTAQQQTGVYAPADTNEDGFTSEDEFQAALAAERQRRGTMQAQAAAEAEASGADELGQVLAMLEDRAVGVEQDYQDRVGELRRMYRTSETPEERAQLQYALGTLEAQRAAGHEVIQGAYGQAMSDSAARAEQVRAAGQRQAGEVGAVYDDAAADVGGIITDAQGQYADSGLGVGATDVSGNVTDWVPLIEGEGARQQALTSQLGQISADDIAFLTEALGGERAAQQGDLERLALMYGADATMAHNARVQDRIAAERMRMADQTAAAQQFYDSRRYDLDDTGLQLALDVYARQLDEAAAGANQPIIPDDPQGAYVAGLDMLGEYGQAALPFIVNNGLIPPEDLALILSSMGAGAPTGE